MVVDWPGLTLDFLILLHRRDRFILRKRELERDKFSDVYLHGMRRVFVFLFSFRTNFLAAMNFIHISTTIVDGGGLEVIGVLGVYGMY